MSVSNSTQERETNKIYLGQSNVKLGDSNDELLERIVDNEDTDLVQLTFEITAGSTTIQKVTVPYDIEILDVIVQPRGASTSGTMKLNDGTNDITNAMACAVDKTIARAGTINDAYSKISAEGDLGVICAGNTVASTKGLVTIIARRT